MKHIALIAALLAAPTLAQAQGKDVLVFTGNSIVVIGEIDTLATIIRDRDASDGCGPLRPDMFSRAAQREIAAQGCGIVMHEEQETVLMDPNPRDGCGRVPLGFLMPALREAVEKEGCAIIMHEEMETI